MINGRVFIKNVYYEIMRVSVIMSVYREPVDWLCQSIDSILHQTFSDFEFIIICDDPSYTEGVTLLRKYSEQDSRIVLLINEKNIGLTKSLNRGVKIAKGDYIARMDADDVSDLQRLSIQYEFMEKNPQIAVCGTGRQILNEEKLSKKTYNTYTDSNDIKSVFVLRSAFTHPTVMIRRSVFDDGYLYDESYICAQDYDLWERLLEKGYVLANIDRPLLRYRMSGIQVSKNKKMLQVSSAKRIRKNFLSSMDITLTEEELDVLVLPFMRNVEINRDDIKKYIRLLEYLQTQMKRKEWFHSQAYQVEAIRFAINLALKSRNKFFCLWDILCSSLATISSLRKNTNYYYNRL